MTNKYYLDEISNNLRSLHKILIDVAMASHTHSHESLSPMQTLRLLTTNKHFEWLQCLSALMIEIDELRRNPKEITDDWIAAIDEQLEGLIFGKAALADEKARTFNKKYLDALQTSPFLVTQNSALRALHLGALER